jgi:hypothetical protein
VGVHEGNARAGRDPTADITSPGYALALDPVNPHPARAPFVALQHIATAIGPSIIDNDDFVGKDGTGEDRSKGFMQFFAFIEARDNQG